MGRPPILPKKKKDGWYIEVRNKGAKSGMILIRDTEVAMFQAAKQYETTKDVLILGEHLFLRRDSVMNSKELPLFF